MDENEVFQEHITLDVTGCKYVKEFWKRIADAFDFGEDFGENWDAFDDLITVECPAHRVTVIGADSLPTDWKTPRGIPFPDMIRNTLQRNKEFKARYYYEFDYEFIGA